MRTATVPNTWAEWAFFVRPKTAYRIKRAISGRMTITLLWACIFTLGRPVEATCHTPGKILSSVT